MEDDVYISIEEQINLIIKIENLETNLQLLEREKRLCCHTNNNFFQMGKKLLFKESNVKYKKYDILITKLTKQINLLKEELFEREKQFYTQINGLNKIQYSAVQNKLFNKINDFEAKLNILSSTSSNKNEDMIIELCRYLDLYKCFAIIFNPVIKNKKYILA